MTFVIDHIFLGESDRTGQQTAIAWKQFGFNIDGKVTTKASIDVCTHAPNADISVQVDGNNGIDNSWGSNLLPILENGAGLTAPSLTDSAEIADGGHSTELTITGLSVDPQQTSTGLSSSTYATGRYPGRPAFDLTTNWPVRPSEVIDHMNVASGPVHSFPNSYINGGTFVADADGSTTLAFNVDVGVVEWPIVVHHAIVTFDHTAPGMATNGTIAGVLDTAEFIAAVRPIAERLARSACDPSTFDGIATQILQAQDILLDGTNGPGVPCNGISIGIGFSGVQIANPTSVSQELPPPDPCLDGG